MHSSRTSVLWLAAAAICAISAGCHKDPKTPAVCTVGDATTCAAGQVCELVQGGNPTCFAPLVVTGQVFDATSPTAAGIADAQVVALDASGQAVAGPVLTDASGNYSLPIPATRDAAGTVLAASVTLRVDASGYVAFPTAPRFGLAIDLTTGVSTGGKLVVTNAATDVSLFPIPVQMPAVTYGTIHGTISGAPAGGALVVAEQAGTTIASAIVAADGTFDLFNVPLNVTTDVAAYAAGVSTPKVSTTVTSSSTAANVTLTATAAGAATVTGSVTIVNPGNGSTTSVVLVLESTFDATFHRGLMPPGLRVGDVSNAFSIPNVPPGDYVVLAAFENDFLVRDPDTTIGGTQIVHITVTAGTDFAIPTAFKITGSLDNPTPGTTGLEVLTVAPTTFTWDDDSGEDGFEFRLYDAYGTEVFTDLAVPKHTGGSTVSYTPVGLPAFTAGMVYQFRVTSWASAVGGTKYLSATEDLLGVFEYQP